ncbi:MAG: DUF790 family protein [Nitrosopumilus sp.]|uniref:DUF790 family protein n=1 Tax=Nitrosopumilus sp. TaxID=2024843 RepID=UPI0029306725|nr:DUF790 family protein [Nitrosopumilus sp.]
MLSSDLLRTKISRGKIEPLFCSLDFGNGTAYELANKLVTFFENTHKNGQSKGELLKKINPLESEFDYKLVRGLFVLLERRSSFEPASFSKKINPFLIRQSLFQESSVRGLALSDLQRQEIIQTVATRANLSATDIEKIMWVDREENLILRKFDFINPKNLLLWYNLSLAQTLLFRCTTLEFFVEGGVHWKHVLRNVKKFGLMYNLEQQPQSNSDSIRCTLEGPLSLFKMTDRYGTSMAKLLPWIIKAPTWRISGSIVRKNDEGSKIYQFAMSNKDTSGILRPISEILHPDNSSDIKNQDSLDNDNGLYTYDSSLERKFEKLFLQYFNKKDDWKISREPNPLVADGKAMIPDFLFERFGKKVYFEIVGFWTREYLERKAAKLRAIFEKNRTNHPEIDLLVGVNSDLACSQIESISDDRIFTFKKEVSIKPILKHLKEIDKKIIEEKTNTTKIRLNEDDGETDIISIDVIAEKYGIPAETALKILSSDHEDHILVGNLLMISKQKIDDIQKNLQGILKFTKACKILETNKIPESSHADILSKLGYDVVWNDLNPDNATINKKTSD